MSPLTTKIAARRPTSEYLPEAARETSLFDSPFLNNFWASPWLGSASTPWRSPFRELSRMQERMEQLFNEMVPAVSIEGAAAAQSFMPLVNITRQDDQYLLSFELPGVRKEDINLEISNEQLVVSGQRKAEKHIKEEAYESRERSEGTFYRSFSLPTDVSAEKISATYENGMLTVMLPRTGVESARRIQITEASHQAVKSSEKTKVA
jgi:HSP20 family protein